MSLSRYQVAKKVIHETIDGEVIVVHLETGCYYSFTGTAVFIWERIVSGVSTSNLLCELVLRYKATPETIETSVQAFLSALERAHLLQPDPSALPDDWVAPPFPSGPDTRQLFEVPLIEEYTDMKELIEIDPIHDVGEEGWPRPAP